MNNLRLGTRGVACAWLHAGPTWPALFPGRRRTPNGEPVLPVAAISSAVTLIATRSRAVRSARAPASPSPPPPSDRRTGTRGQRRAGAWTAGMRALSHRAACEGQGGPGAGQGACAGLKARQAVGPKRAAASRPLRSWRACTWRWDVREARELVGPAGWTGGLSSWCTVGRYVAGRFLFIRGHGDASKLRSVPVQVTSVGRCGLSSSKCPYCLLTYSIVLNVYWSVTHTLRRFTITTM
jgi:hypothetical protein